MSLPESAYATADWPARPADRHPDTLVWVDRIEAVRRGPERHCRKCGETQPLEAFSLDRGRRGGGRMYVCRDCDAARTRRERAARKRTAFRSILERAS